MTAQTGDFVRPTGDRRAALTEALPPHQSWCHAEAHHDCCHGECDCGVAEATDRLAVVVDRALTTAQAADDGQPAGRHAKKGK